MGMSYVAESIADCEQSQGWLH